MKISAIFDMDGVLVNNNPWHIQAWITFAERHGLSITPQEVESHFGNTNRDYLTFLFRKELQPHEIEELAEEKEMIYRSLCEQYIEPVNGLIHFLEQLKKFQFGIAIATGGPLSNVRFVMDKLKTSHLFDVYVYDSMVKKGKPDPELFLKAAELLGTSPRHCVVFEDSVHGIEAARRASMLPVGINTSGNREKLKNASLVVNDFTELTAESVLEMLNNRKDI